MGGVDELIADLVWLADEPTGTIHAAPEPFEDETGAVALCGARVTATRLAVRSVNLPTCSHCERLVGAPELERLEALSLARSFCHDEIEEEVVSLFERSVALATRQPFAGLGVEGEDPGVVLRMLASGSDPELAEFARYSVDYHAGKARMAKERGWRYEQQRQENRAARWAGIAKSLEAVNN